MNSSENSTSSTKISCYISVFLILALWDFSYGQRTEVEKYYVRVDTAFVTELKQAYEISAEKLMTTLEVTNSGRQNLGFGYQWKESGKGLGSMTIHYQILYYKNDIVSFELSTRIPSKSKRLKKLYKEKLSTLFTVNNDFKVKPIYFQFHKATEPLHGIEPKTSNNLDKIMSPFSGIIYGDYCGSRMRKLPNRKLFDQLIKIENCAYLLYSKNPATRLMAIEFYYDHQTKFSTIQKKSIDARIAQLKRKPMLVRTCSGCFIGRDSTEKIIKELKNTKE